MTATVKLPGHFDGDGCRWPGRPETGHERRVPCWSCTFNHHDECDVVYAPDGDVACCCDLYDVLITQGNAG